MVSVYSAPEVQDCAALHPYLTDRAFRALPIRAQLAQQAETLHAGFAAKDPRVRMQVGSWWPDAAGQSWDELMARAFDQHDARLTIAREYGFDDWAAVDALGDVRVPLDFEQALDAVLSGRIEDLERQLSDQPGLALATSVFGHRATLLHYLGANGVESHRQCVPENAVDMAKLLLRFGARKQATANMYGGGQTPYDLAATSAHPYRAGLAKALNTVLRP